MAASDGRSREAPVGRTGIIVAFLGTLAGASLLLWRPTDRKHSVHTGRGDPGVPASAHAVAEGYEHVDASAYKIVRATAILGGYAVLMVGLMVLMLHIFGASTERRDANLTAEQRRPVEVPSPHLQAAPYVELHDERSREDGRLAGYAWVGNDRSHARIPLERAMALTAGRSLDLGPDGPAPSATSAPAPTSGHP